MLYKLKIENIVNNIYFDSNDNWIYFFNEINFTFGFNVLNPYHYNTDSYNYYNMFVIEKLKLYDDSYRFLFENHIKKCIENKNFTFSSFKGLSIIIEKTNLNIDDYKKVL